MISKLRNKGNINRKKEELMGKEVYKSNIW